ncbi:MAG: carbon-nitrogen hydrolase family protein [Deltaproteobacteria bacterium]|nr:carbon-nitrogen hydrolase family protein [Deltaproteobacteria bacterium]
MESGPDLAANLARSRALVVEAAARHARLVVLPEVFAWRGPREAEAGVASPIPGPVSDFLCGLAAELGVTLVGGSFLERSDEATRSFNTSLLIDPRGAIRAVYRKMHLFDVDLPGRVTVRESDARIPGTDVVTAPTELGTVGMSICYDLRFPELFRRLAVAGATIVTIPSAFTAYTGAAHWEPLLRARAIENQVFVIAPNQTGTSPHGFHDYGHSMIVDPWGTVLARASEGEAVITAELDLDHLARVRREMPCLHHTRLLS